MRFAVLAYSYDASVGAGAARASELQVQALRASGHEVLTVSADDVRDGSVWRKDQPLRPTNGAFWSLISNRAGSDRLRSLLSDFGPDCLILNSVDRGTLSLSDIGTLEWPIVWFVRDSWIYTGGCLFKLPPEKDLLEPSVTQPFFTSLTCTGFEQNCSDCPILKPSEASIAAIHFSIKSRMLSERRDIVFAGISEWMTAQLKVAPLTEEHQSLHIPNWVPMRVEYGTSGPAALGRGTIRKDENRITVMVGAHSLSNERKGLKVLEEGLRADPSLRGKFRFVSIGGGDRGGLIEPLGHLDQTGVQQALQACEIVCVPSLQESQSIFAIEATLQGKPIVCFDTSGLTTLVKHKVNGYVARAFDPTDLTAGIEWVSQPENYKGLATAARLISEEKFTDLKKYSSLVERAARTAIYQYAKRPPNFESISCYVEPWILNEPTRDLSYLERRRLTKRILVRIRNVMRFVGRRVVQIVRRTVS